jgi:hypothetical protein
MALNRDGANGMHGKGFSDDPEGDFRRKMAAMNEPEVIYGYNAPERLRPQMSDGGAGTMPSSIAALDQTVQAPGYARGSAGGSANISQDAYDSQQQLQLAHDLRMKEFDYKKQAISALVGGGTSARVTRGPENQAAEQAARDAAFARAKEKAGQTARASMTTLNNVMSERGMTGSSVAAGHSGRIVGGAAGEIGEFLRDQAITEADRAAEVSDMDFMAQVSQRGQEMQRKQALMSLLGNLY